MREATSLVTRYSTRARNRKTEDYLPGAVSFAVTGYGLDLITNQRSVPSVGKNRGGRLCLVACSNEYAKRNSAGSLHARPKNEIPTGSPCTCPAGT